jgi:LPS-assembly lipoprotein
MSSFNHAVRAALLALVLTAPLAACTGLTPVYGDRGFSSQRLEVAYGEPRNRVEQIIYQDLALRLGKSSAAGQVPRVIVAASQRASDLTAESVGAPNNQNQMTVTAKITVTDASGLVVFSGTRSQTADYTTDAQPLATQQAADDAARRAALLLADTIRLEALAALSQ